MRSVSSDAELVTRLRSGEEAAFIELVERYHAQLIRLAGSFLARTETAEDVAQETWLALLNGIDRFEGRSSVKTWLFQICANRARTVGVREHRTVPVAEIGPAVDAARFTTAGDWATPPAAWPDQLAEEAADAELVVLIRQAVDELPPLQRAVVTLRDVQGLTGKQTCELLSITEANQRVLLHRGREQVRLAMNRAVTR